MSLHISAMSRYFASLSENASRHAKYVRRLVAMEILLTSCDRTFFGVSPSPATPEDGISSHFMQALLFEMLDRWDLSLSTFVHAPQLEICTTNTTLTLGHSCCSSA